MRNLSVTRKKNCFGNAVIWACARVKVVGPKWAYVRRLELIPTMAEDRQILNEYTDHPLVNPALPKRKKTVSRIYFGIVGFFMFVLLLLCAIALGSFGEFQRQLSGFYKLPLLQGDKCMLFATVNEDNIIRYNSYSPCIFIFWGLVSGIILSFTLFVYSIVMAVIGSKV